MSTPEAIFFDLDDTLLDFTGSLSAITTTCNELGARLSLDPARILQANTAAWDAIWPEVERHWTLGGITGGEVTLQVWRRTLSACGCNDEAMGLLARQLHAAHFEAHVRLFDDVEGLFTAIPGDIPLALITNGASDSQRDKLRLRDLEVHFGAIVISGEVGIAKPDPRVFGLAIQKLAVNPDQVWHVGDSLRNDVAGARAAGLGAVWLNRTGRSLSEEDPIPDHEITSLADLVALLGGRLV